MAITALIQVALPVLLQPHQFRNTYDGDNTTFVSIR